MEPGNEETVESLRTTLSLEVEHNNTLIKEKKMLQEALNDEREGQTELGEKVAVLERIKRENLESKGERAVDNYRHIGTPNTRGRA